MTSSPSLKSISYFKFVLPPTAPLRYKTAGFSPSTTIIEVINKLSDLCHFVNFAECGYGLYLPKGNGPTRGRWLENDKLLSDYPLNQEESIELRKKPGFRSNPNMPASTSLPLKEGNVLRYSPLSRLWSPCVLRLYNIKLAICTSEHDNNPDVILFASVTKVAESSEKKYAFFVAVEDTKTTLRCRNGAEMMEWVKVLGETVSTVNPDLLFDASAYNTSRPSPRTHRSRTLSTSFLSLITRDDNNSSGSSSNNSSPVLSSSLSANSIAQADALRGSGPVAPPSPRAGGLTPREERKKYSFLTLRNSKKSKEKSQRDILKEAKEKEERKERGKDKQDVKGKRGRGVTISHPSSAVSSPNLSSTTGILSLSLSGLSSSTNLSSSTGSTSSPTTPTRAPKVSYDFPFLDDEDTGIRVRSHSTSTTNIPSIPTIQSLLAAKRLSTNEAENNSLREKLQYQTEHNRQIEEKYQKLLMKYSEQANKSSYKDFSKLPISPRADAPSPPLFTSSSSPSNLFGTIYTSESESQNSPRMRKSTSMWRFSRKAYEPELLELKLEIQQLKTDNRLMRIQLDRRTDRELRTSASGATQSAKGERKRTSPRSRKLRREDIEREKSLTRLDTRRNSDADSTVRARSASTHSENAGDDVFLRDNIRSDFMRDSSRSDLGASMQRESSRGELSASGDGLRRDASSSAAEFEYLQKEMTVLRDRLQEQQSLFQQEEVSRLDLETDFRKNQELDERLLVDMEGVTRVLKKSLGDLKDQLEVEMQCLQLDSSDDEEME